MYIVKGKILSPGPIHTHLVFTSQARVDWKDSTEALNGSADESCEGSGVDEYEEADGERTPNVVS